MSKNKDMAGILLAAGESKRFKGTKQLSHFNKKVLLIWALEAAILSLLDKVYLVLGHQYQDILNAIEPYANHPKMQIIHNPNYKKGISCSLKAGILMAAPFYNNVMFLLGDQPLITSSIIDQHLNAFFNTSKRISVLSFHGKQRNPTIFNARYYPEILKLKHDTGAKKIIQAHGEDVHYLNMTDKNIFRDIDTPRELNELEKALALYQTAKKCPDKKN